MGVPLYLLIQEKYGVFNHTVSCHSLVLNGHVSANIICSDSNVVTFPGKYAATIMDTLANTELFLLVADRLCDRNHVK